METDPRLITQLLNRLGADDGKAAEELWPLVYDELHRLAEIHMARENPGRTLQPTALVNEAWLAFAQGSGKEFPGRAHFYQLASKIMRSVLVDAARARNAKKRGGDLERISLNGELAGDGGRNVDLLDLDDALGRLEERDPELAQLVEMRFFGGMKHPAIADALGQSLRNVERNWHMARTWLYAELAG